MKYTEQFKLLVVQRYLDGSEGFKTLAQTFGIADSMLRAWVARFRLHGAAGLSKPRSHYHHDFKLKVLQHMWDNGLSYRQTAAVFNIPKDSSIGEWDRRYKCGGADSLASRGGLKGKVKSPINNSASASNGASQRTHQELLERLAYLEAENAYLKKLKALLDAQKPVAAKKRK